MQPSYEPVVVRLHGVLLRAAAAIASSAQSIAAAFAPTAAGAPAAGCVRRAVWLLDLRRVRCARVHVLANHGSQIVRLHGVLLRSPAADASPAQPITATGATAAATPSSSDRY